MTGKLVYLINNEGKEIDSKSFDSSLHIVFDVDALPEGTYYIKSDNIKVETQKIIIMNSGESENYQAHPSEKINEKKNNKKSVGKKSRNQVNTSKAYLN